MARTSKSAGRAAEKLPMMVQVQEDLEQLQEKVEKMRMEQVRVANELVRFSGRQRGILSAISDMKIYCDLVDEVTARRWPERHRPAPPFEDEEPFPKREEPFARPVRSPYIREPFARMEVPRSFEELRYDDEEHDSMVVGGPYVLSTDSNLGVARLTGSEVVLQCSSRHALARFLSQTTLKDLGLEDSEQDEIHLNTWARPVLERGRHEETRVPGCEWFVRLTRPDSHKYVDSGRPLPAPTGPAATWISSLQERSVAPFAGESWDTEWRSPSPVPPSVPAATLRRTDTPVPPLTPAPPSASVRSSSLARLFRPDAPQVLAPASADLSWNTWEEGGSVDV